MYSACENIFVIPRNIANGRAAGVSEIAIVIEYNVVVNKIPYITSLTAFHFRNDGWIAGVKGTRVTLKPESALHCLTRSKR